MNLTLRCGSTKLCRLILWQVHAFKRSRLKVASPCMGCVSYAWSEESFAAKLPGHDQGREGLHPKTL